MNGAQYRIRPEIEEEHCSFIQDTERRKCFFQGQEAVRTGSINAERPLSIFHRLYKSVS